MEITFIWSWASFVAGILFTIVGAIALGVVYNLRQFNKNKRR